MTGYLVRIAIETLDDQIHIFIDAHGILLDDHFSNVSPVSLCRPIGIKKRCRLR